MEKDTSKQIETSNDVEPVGEPVRATRTTDVHEAWKDAPLVVKQAHENNFHVDLGWRSWLIMFLCCFCLAGQILLFTAVGQAIAFIVRQLGEPELVGWVIQGPLLMQSILSPTVGRLSDILDRKWMVTVPPIIALAGSVMAAKAQNMSMLIGGSILIGVSLPSAAVLHAVQAEILPLKFRAVANGINFVTVCLGAIIGSLLSGALTDRSADGWRAVYWIQVGFQGITALGFLFFYWPEAHPEYPDMSFKQLFWKVDPIGSFFFVSSCTLLLVALAWAGGTYPWDDPHVVAPLVIGFVLLIVFMLYEWKGRNDGLVAHVFFESGPNFPFGILAFLVEGWIYYSAVNNLTPQEILHLGYKTKAFDVSVRQLAFALPTLTACICITTWATRQKDLVRPLFWTFLLFVVGTICWATLTPEQPAAQLVYAIISMIPSFNGPSALKPFADIPQVGIGQAGPMTLLVPLIQFTAPHALLSTASGLIYSARAIGGAFGTAVLNVIINNYLHKHLSASVGNAAIQAGLPKSSVPRLLQGMSSGSPKLLSAVPGINGSIIAVATRESQWVYSRAYRLAWWSIFPFAILCTIGTLLLKNVKEMMTEKVEATVEHLDNKHDKA